MVNLSVIINNLTCSRLHLNHEGTIERNIERKIIKYRYYNYFSNGRFRESSYENIDKLLLRNCNKGF